jgi:hypothetical protein
MSIFRLITVFLLTVVSLGAAPANLPPAQTRELSVKTNGIIASPTNFFQSNLLPGDNITIVPVGDGRIILHSAAGTGMASTNGLASTNYVQDATPISAKWKGAKADGTDATEAIQSAINEATNRSIFLPGGTYVITAPLTNLSGRTIEGEGVGTVLVPTGITSCFYASNTANLTIRNLRISGDNAVSGIYSKHASNLKFSGLQIDNCTASNATVATEAIIGILSTNILVENSVFLDNGFNPGDTTNASPHVTGTLFFSGDTTNRCERIRVENCTIRNLGIYAVQFTSCDKVDVIGVEVDQGNSGCAPWQNGYGITSYDGTHITGSGSREKRIRIENCTVYNAAGIGIYCVLGDEVVIKNCFVDNVALGMQSPVLLASGINANECRRFTIADNIVCNVGFSGATNTTAGIAIIAGEYGTIKNNSITNVVSPTGDGINLGNYGQYTLRCFALDVSDNKIANVTRAGILTAGRALEHCTFKNNSVFDSQTHGLWFDRITRCVIEGNYVQNYGASGYGIFAPNTTGTNWFNTYRANKVANVVEPRTGAAFRIISASNIFDGNIAVGIASIATAFSDVGGSNVWSGNITAGQVTKDFDIPSSSAAMRGNYNSYAGPPTNAPSRIGETYFNTTDKSFWIAGGTSDADDWFPVSNQGLTKSYNWTNSDVAWEFAGKGIGNANLSTEGHWYVTAGPGYGTYFGNSTNLDAVRVDAYGRLLVKDGGKVGIGTNLPQSALHVVGNIAASNLVQIVAGSNVTLSEVQTPTNKIVTVSATGGGGGTAYVTFDQEINTFTFDLQ